MTDKDGDNDVVKYVDKEVDNLSKMWTSALSLLELEWVATDTALSCYIAIPASLLSITLLHNTLQLLTFTTVNTTFPEIARLANKDQCPVQKQHILCTTVHYLVTCGAFQGSCMFLPIKV